MFKINLLRCVIHRIPIPVMLLAIQGAYATGTLHGQVMEKDPGTSRLIPITGANVYFLGSFDATVSDEHGMFEIPLRHELPDTIVVSFVGYKNDTTVVSGRDAPRIILTKSINLTAVQVTAKKESVAISTIQTLNAEKITGKELLRAACCNLSEAFETSPTVNISYKDAVTGAKEIQMLGLSGIYSQLLTENIPNMRGIAGIYGLSFIPGPWMESIQVTKGSGSVVNGYESTTGQINIEYLKPDQVETPRYYLNLFTEDNTNSEINTHWKKKINDKWSTIVMAHGNYMDREMDVNHDGFMDVPRNRQVNIMNNWMYHSGRHLESRFGFKYLDENRKGGQTAEAIEKSALPEHYSTGISTRRAEAYGKFGFVYPDNPFKSIGNIVQLTWHDMNSSFGKKTYNALQKSLYVQSIYQNVFSKPEHEYKVGFSYRLDRLDESYNSQPSLTTESVPGVFAEYTYSYIDKLKVIAGAREDYHNGYGWVFTPRLHAKYNFTGDFLFRMSIGRSFRVPYLYADNISQFASSKSIRVLEAIRPERAWNYGINFTRRHTIAGHEGSLILDLYRTQFENQLVMDAYSDSSAILFYNLAGKSFANSYQVTLSQELVKGIEIRIAYKRDDVKSTYDGKLLSKPLIPSDKLLFTLSMATNNGHWRFDLTQDWEGRKRLQTDAGTDNRENRYSPDYFVSYLQVTKVFRKFELYAGSENLFDYRQKNPIIDAANPFSPSFDATNVWGPIEGRRIYAGLRYSIL